jgi:site-specific DNA-methyltransferase (adenine-specific)
MNIAIHKDCMEVMQQYPDKYFDLAVVDPPYFSGPELRQHYGGEISATGIPRKEYPITEKWVVPGSEYFEELFRVSKLHIIWGCNYYDYNFSPGRIVWDKCNGNSSFSDCEIAATNCHDSVRLFRYMWNGMMQGKSINEGHIMRGNKALNEVRIHPTQKPLDLYRWIYSRYAQPGFRILDTHLGSGTSRRAAYDFGLDFVGCEISKDYFEKQEQAFLEYTAQMRFI